MKIIYFILGTIFQLICMIIPIIIIAIIVISTIASFWLGLLLIIIFWHQHFKDEDGLFFAWKIKNIKAFYKNWNKIA